MNKLKPCPFCGGEAKFLTICFGERGVSRGWQFEIYCAKCNVTTPKTNYRLEVRLDEFGDIVTTIDERDKAIEAWNRRVEQNG